MIPSYSLHRSGTSPLSPPSATPQCVHYIIYPRLYPGLSDSQATASDQLFPVTAGSVCLQLRIAEKDYEEVFFALVGRIAVALLARVGSQARFLAYGILGCKGALLTEVVPAV